ncbi:MAG TPA: Ig-like domain-containing protein [Gemmatimonadales bacterium]|nr:Ig-like domain-containing protein [Gemmatimonadales bacterium]
MIRPRILTLLGLGLMAACDEPASVGPVPPPPVPPLITVLVGPDDATIVSGRSLQYQAVSTSTVAGWEWSVPNPVYGTISANGTFTAGQPGTFQILACASNGPSICGAVRVTVVALPASGGAPAITLLPESTVISIGQTVEFMATASNFTPSGWTWLALDNATATIDANGLLTARRPGLTVVAVCSTDQPHYCSSAQVRVQ